MQKWVPYPGARDGRLASAVDQGPHGYTPDTVCNSFAFAGKVDRGGSLTPDLVVITPKGQEFLRDLGLAE